MAANKSVLSDLIKGRVSAQVGQENDLRMLSLDLLDDNDKNDIFKILDDELEELMDSIYTIGLQDPLTVTPNGGRYRIISGHRRSKAVRKLCEEYPEEKNKWALVPCYIKRYASPEYEELALIMANSVVRKDKSWIVPSADRVRRNLEAIAKQEGVKIRGKMQSEIARILNLSRQELQRQEYISKRLEKVVRERWPNLPTQTAVLIAQQNPNVQRNIAENFPPWMDGPTKQDILNIVSAFQCGNNWFHIQESKKREEQKLQKEAKEARKAERKKRDNDYRTELALKTLGMEVEPKEPPSPQKPTLTSLGYDDKLVRERFKKAREMAKKEDLSNVEKYGYGTIGDIVKASKIYHCSADYLVGLTEYPTITPDSSPVPAAPEWKLITADAQPPEGLTVEVVTWMDNRWYRGRMAWHPDYLDSGMVQMWMECIPLPPPPENGGGAT